METKTRRKLTKEKGRRGRIEASETRKETRDGEGERRGRRETRKRRDEEEERRGRRDTRKRERRIREPRKRGEGTRLFPCRGPSSRFAAVGCRHYSPARRRPVIIPPAAIIDLHSNQIASSSSASPPLVLVLLLRLLPSSHPLQLARCRSCLPRRPFASASASSPVLLAGPFACLQISVLLFCPSSPFWLLHCMKSKEGIAPPHHHRQPQTRPHRFSSQLCHHYHQPPISSAARRRSR